jgi:hypothetical protein
MKHENDSQAENVLEQKGSMGRMDSRYAQEGQEGP